MARATVRLFWMLFLDITLFWTSHCRLFSEVPHWVFLHHMVRDVCVRALCAQCEKDDNAALLLETRFVAGGAEWRSEVASRDAVCFARRRVTWRVSDASVINLGVLSRDKVRGRPDVS